MFPSRRLTERRCCLLVSDLGTASHVDRRIEPGCERIGWHCDLQGRLDFPRRTRCLLPSRWDSKGYGIEYFRTCDACNVASARLWLRPGVSDSADCIGTGDEFNRQRERRRCDGKVQGWNAVP